ncbi:hypothetical protein FA95DRAFT_1574951 [Auriscalpium vulgare]|uniref:Uncharacterized protein n=1 Tax=Auriscalpium vulgare TaxID=40419 RepID=A0ACB8RHI4_9AGAM|nr:hypothetical protein FA95DRAFT_1574951 [Auriscalpium vulgare]
MLSFAKIVTRTPFTTRQPAYQAPPRDVVASPSKVAQQAIIDLTLDSDSEDEADRSCIKDAFSDINVIAANCSSEVEIVYDVDDTWSDIEVVESPAGPSKSRNGAALYEAGDLDDDERLARRLQESEERLEDEKLAIRLQEEERLQALQELPERELATRLEDERLARSLTEQEDAQFQTVVNAVEAKEDGIVFKVVVDAATNTLDDGCPAHPDDLARFEPWKALFERSGLKVKKFHWFVNYELEKRFEHARQTLELLCGEAPQELPMFHGTKSENIDSILKGGFRIGGMGGQAVVNGTALGYGIYLAGDAATSMGYTVGGNRMFACRVLPGRTTTNMTFSKTVPRSIDVGTEPFESYSTAINPAGQQACPFGVLVVRYTSLVLPCYMIEWDSPAYASTFMARPLPMPPTVPRANVVLGGVQIQNYNPIPQPLAALATIGMVGPIPYPPYGVTIPAQMRQSEKKGREDTGGEVDHEGTGEDTCEEGDEGECICEDTGYG